MAAATATDNLSEKDIGSLVECLRETTRRLEEAACTCVGAGFGFSITHQPRINPDTGHERGCQGVAYTKRARALLKRIA
jgi:hypothetical protein